MAASSNGTGNVVAIGRKWNREDRKQKEMEVKLALMLSASQLPLNIIENSFFREFMEYVQPRFSMPHDINYIEEVILLFVRTASLEKFTFKLSTTSRYYF